MQYNAIMMQQDSAKLSRDFREYMRQHCWSQSYVAEKTNVNQATVSRFLKNPPRRATAPFQRLCRYANDVLSGAEDQDDKAAVSSAFDECWRKSEAHANALSKIINAFVELCRREERSG